MLEVKTYLNPMRLPMSNEFPLYFTRAASILVDFEIDIKHLTHTANGVKDGLHYIKWEKNYKKQFNCDGRVLFGSLKLIYFVTILRIS